MRIFIGSSGEAQKKAARISRRLKNEGFTVFEWWDKTKVFRAGDYVIDRLREISHMCDGAIFVFNADDKKWPRHFDPYSMSISYAEGENVPRDNVILEYGIFLATHNRNNVFVVVDSKSKIKLPSDMHGITHVSIGAPSYIRDIIQRMKDLNIDHAHLGYSPDQRVLCRKQHVEKLFEIPDHWSSRALYVGRQSAKLWRSIEQDQVYNDSRRTAVLLDAVKEFSDLLANKYFDNIVSFGPGIGSNDIKVISQLGGGRAKKYIPIDINYYLLVHAAENVDKYFGDVAVPVAIHGDFEEEIGLISHTLRQNIIGRTLYLMLGGTFGNIETMETGFIHELYALMMTGDYFLLDTFFYDSSYHDDNEVYRNLATYPPSVKNFFAHGIARRTNITYDDVKRNFENYITIGDINSDMKRTKGVTLWIKGYDKKIVNIRRYYLDDIEEAFVHSGFRVLKRYLSDPDKNGVMRGVLLVEKH